MATTSFPPDPTANLIQQMTSGENSRRSNQSLQLTAGRSDAAHRFMKTLPFQSKLALASGG